MAAWEYFTIRNDDELNALGREGWELVAVRPDESGGGATFYLKRPGHDFRERVTLEQKRYYYKLMGIQPSDDGEGKEG